MKSDPPARDTATCGDWKGMLDRMPDAFYRMRLPEGAYEYLNPACAKVFGYPIERMLANPLLVRDALHPDFAEDFERQWEDLLRGRVPKCYEYRIVDAEGRERWIFQTNAGVFDDAGKIRAVEGVCRDVTAVKRAQAALAAAHTQLQEILDMSRDILYRRDLESGTYQYISRAFGRLLGYGEDEVAGMAFQGVGGLIHPADRPRHDAYIERLLADGSGASPPEAVEYRMRCRDGSYRWFRDQMTVARDPVGRPLFVVGNNRDISARRIAEQSLREAHERLLAVLDSLDAHIYVADMETCTILFMNRKMKEDFGADLVGRICHEAFRGDDRPCAHCTNQRLLDADGEPTGVCVWEDENPLTGRWYVNHDRAIRWFDGRWVRLQIATDLTDVKRLEKERTEALEQLHQAQKLEAIGTLAGGLAHDFNNLLMGILGHLNLIQADLPPGHPHHDRLARVEEMVASGSRLTAQLLGYARKGKYEVRRLDLNALVAEVLEAFGRTRKDIVVRCDLEPGRPVVEGDRGQMEQVLWNLCVNASEAMPRGGELAVSTRTAAPDDPGGRPLAVLEFADNGRGMDEETAKRVFDPFFSTKARGRGTGLGLASVYGIVRGHGGEIAVASAVGRGTRFTITLPAATREQAAVVPTGTDSAKTVHTVLMVDDEDFVREVGRDILVHLGYRVLTAPDGQRAIELYREGRGDIDLVVLDMIMPGMGGGEVFDRLRRVDPGVRVLLSSGYSVEGEAQAILDRGCDGFIQKPFSVADLKAKIREVLTGGAGLTACG